MRNRSEKVMGRRRTRSSMAAMAIKNKKMGFLSRNSMVEVRINRYMFKRAWYLAKVLESNPKGIIRVQYQSNPPITEWVHISSIRPLPPPPAPHQTYKPHDFVDAFRRNGWWKGVVSKVSVLEEEEEEKSKSRMVYTVVFENSPEILDFCSANLRFHLDWTDGRWVRPPNQEIINIEDCEKQSEHVHNTANHTKVVPETVETLSNHAKKSTPSTLTKSTEQVTDSTLAKCSTRDSGANLLLNKGKNTNPNLQEAGPENRMEEYSKKRERELNAQVTCQEDAVADLIFYWSEEGEEEKSAHVSLEGSSTSENHGEKQPSVKKSRKNPLEQSTSPNTRSTSKNQKMSTPEIEETLQNCSNKFRKENSANNLSPDQCRATSMLMNSTERVTDCEITKCSTIDTSRNLQLAGSKSNSPNKGKNSVLPNGTQCEEQSAHVFLKGSSTADNRGEEQSSVEKLRKNSLEHSTPPSTTSTSKKQKMSAPETEETLPNYSNKFRTESCANILSPDDCRVTLMSMNSTEQVTDSATTKCSTFEMSGDGMPESHEKREIGLNARVTGQQVPAAAGDEKTIEDPAEVINGGNVENFNQSSAINIQAESEPVGNEDMPFRKTSILWKHIDSLEVFRILPQKPHFNPLLDCNEESREGAAIGHMLTFSSMVEKVSKLQIEDPRSLFDSYSEALAILEVIGFDVKAVVDRINELLSLKTRQEQLDNQSKRYQSCVAECVDKKAKLEHEITAIYKTMSELEERLALKKSQKVKEDSSREFLQLQVSSVKDSMFDLEPKFKVKSACPLAESYIEYFH